jgi:hypothetical protein
VSTKKKKICERQHFTISELSCEFPQISVTGLYEIITVRLGNQKVWCKMGSENAHRCTQDKKNGFSFDLFKAIPQRWQSYS